MILPRFFRLWMPVFLVTSTVGFSVLGQTPSNCAVKTEPDPQRQVFQCEGGLVIELELAAQLGFDVAAADGSPEIVDLKSGAALIEVTRRERQTQIRTPHAIAAVRGTVYVVDVKEENTSVFVVRGQVAVSALQEVTAPVLLGPGQGVDVSPGSPLEVKEWGEARISGLLARFGR